VCNNSKKTLKVIFFLKSEKSVKNVKKRRPTAYVGYSFTGRSITQFSTFRSLLIALLFTARYASVVYPSVCLSVTSRCSTKMAKRSITHTTPYDSSGSLVFLKPKTSAKFDRDHSLLGRQMQVGWVKIGDFRQIAGYISIRSSAIAEGPRDASCRLKSCQLPRNSAETTCTTSPHQIDGMKLEV